MTVALGLTETEIGRPNLVSCVVFNSAQRGFLGSSSVSVTCPAATSPLRLANATASLKRFFRFCAVLVRLSQDWYVATNTCELLNSKLTHCCQHERIGATTETRPWFSWKHIFV
jgi:hypothetical protein